MIRKTILGILGLLVVLIAAGLGALFWLRTSLPQTSGSVTLPGLNSPVEIVRDTNAVPHIFAETPEDAYFALGFVHAQDRLWQMEFMRRLGAGRLAEVLGGEPAVRTDRYIRTLGIYDLAEANVEALSPEVRAAFEAYAAGVNAWIETRSGALPPEFLLLRFEPEPWRAADSLVWNRLIALRLGRNRRTELMRARLAEALASKDLPPEMLNELWPEDPPGAPVTLASVTHGARLALDDLWYSLPPGLSDGASNAWVVHGRLTESGKPVLANDPHLGFGAPGLWYLARIEAPGLTVTGATVPGVPLTILGHNGRIAWGITNAGGDVEDLCVETLDPQDPGSYLTPDGPRPFAAREELIRVKGEETIVMTVRETRHGPVISDVSKDAATVAGAGHVIALATPALLSGDRTTEALFAINRARNWDDFTAATDQIHTPHQNLMFAATDGDIGFVSAGRIPVRKAGDGRAPVPGADGTYDWEGFIPAEMLPRTHNPPAGRIVNANNRIVGEGYPYLITKDWALPFRAERIVEVLDAQDSHSVSNSQALQHDVVSMAARLLLPLMLRVEPISGRGRQAVELLSRWDFRMRRDRPEPLIYAAWLRQLVSALAGDELGDELLAGYLGLVHSPSPRFVEAVLTRHRHWCNDIDTPREESCGQRLGLTLDRALDEIAADHGPKMDAWRWGAAHRATFTHRVLTHLPIVRWWADLAIESDGGDNTVNRGTTPRGGRPGSPFNHTDGAGFRAVYDLADLDNSVFMIATGQSGNFLSRHYADMLHRWRDGQYIRIAGDRDEIAATGIGRLSLLPVAKR